MDLKIQHLLYGCTYINTYVYIFISVFNYFHYLLKDKNYIAEDSDYILFKT